MAEAVNELKKKGLPVNRVLREAKTRLVLAILPAMALATGCGLTKATVRINYIPAANVQKVSGAEAVNLTVEAVDQRIIKTEVGKKGNEYSFLGQIVATNDVAQLIADAIETELAHRGFGLADGPVRIVATLSKFYGEYQKEFFSERVVGELVMQVQVKRADGNLLFAKMITGQGTETVGMLRTGEVTKRALEKALQNAIPRLVDDQEFLQALLSASTARSE